MEQKKTSPELQVLQGNALFTTNIYKLLSRNEGNIFFSPISIHAVLSMLHHGAEGETAEVLQHALKSTNAEGYKRIMGYLNTVADFKLMMANKLYGNKDNKKFSKDFEEVLRTSFSSEVEFLDVENQKQSAKTVNDWVESKTDHKIKNIVNETMFNKNLSLILINAIYFNGKWASQFQSSNTQKQQFFPEKSKPKEVEMMFQKGEYNYKHDEDLDAQIIEVPYRGFTSSMFIILPPESSSVSNLESKLANYDLTNVWKGMKMEHVRFYLPKFKMEATIKLNDILREMGLADIFDMKRANFTKMIDQSAGSGLHVSEIIQKAYVKVDEAGTEAAAATRAGLMLGAAPGIPKVVTFKVDRPAIIMLLASHGDDARSVLFYGRLVHP